MFYGGNYIMIWAGCTGPEADPQFSRVIHEPHRLRKRLRAVIVVTSNYTSHDARAL